MGKYDLISCHSRQVSRSGILVEHLISLVQKCIRNKANVEDNWRGAIIAVFECVMAVTTKAPRDAVKKPDAKRLPSVQWQINARKLYTQMLHRLMIISVEDVLNPPLACYILQTLSSWANAKTYVTNDQRLQELIVITLALCFSHKFRPSVLVHPHCPDNHAISIQHGLTFDGNLFTAKDWTLPELRIEIYSKKNLAVFGLLLFADIKDVQNLSTEHKRLHIVAQNVATIVWSKHAWLHKIYESRPAESDRRAYLQYGLMLEILGPTMIAGAFGGGETEWLKPKQPLPIEFERLTNSTIDELLIALKEHRYNLIIPTDSIVNDKHTPRLKTVPAHQYTESFFRANSIVNPVFPALQPLYELCQPIYVQCSIQKNNH